MVPDDSLTIRERAVAAWPTAWQGQNLRDILVTLGLRRRPALARAVQEGPRLDSVHRRAAHRAGLCRATRRAETRRALKRKEEPSYMGTFTSARRHVLHTFANTQSPLMKKRASQYMLSTECPLCHGKRLRRESLSVKFAGLDIADISRLPLKRLADLLRPYARRHRARTGEAAGRASGKGGGHPADRAGSRGPARRPARSRAGLSHAGAQHAHPFAGELQRLRLATQVRSNLFGVVYVLDEPSAGLHPADTEALLAALDQLKAPGNSLFVVEHELDVIRHADWIVDVGPAAGVARRPRSSTAARPTGSQRVQSLANSASPVRPRRLLPAARRARPGAGSGWPASRGTTCTAWMWTFRSACSPRSPAYRARANRAWSARHWSSWSPSHLGHELPPEDEEGEELERTAVIATGGRIAAAWKAIKRLVRGRSEADRTHSALQPGHLHRPVRPRPQAVCRDQAGARPALRRRPLLVQRGQGPLRNLRGRRFRHGGAAVSAQRVCALSRPATARATTPRLWRSRIATRTSPTCWA